MPRICSGKCKLLNSIFYHFHITNLTFMFCCLEYFFRKILGRILVFLVYCILAFIAFTVVTIVLPFESLHLPKWSIFLLAIFALYLIINIIYHYHKASTTHPGSPPKLLCDPLCRHCRNYKPAGTHHCAICNACVLKMDHHCVWVNQCVGAMNHRHFLQFLAFLVCGCATFVLAAFHTFYYNFWHRFTNSEYCSAEELTWLPWFVWFCDDDTLSFVNSCVFFSYFLCLLVFFLVSGLFYWNFVLISANLTYIGLLQQNKTCGEIMRLVMFPYKNEHFLVNWRLFLGLKSGSGRSFVRHILFPSNHISRSYEEFLPPNLESIVVDCEDKSNPMNISQRCVTEI